jgi:hypothetical protein
MVKTISETDTLEQSDSSLSALLVIVTAEKNHRQLNVLKGTHGGEQVESLEHEANMTKTQL